MTEAEAIEAIDKAVQAYIVTQHPEGELLVGWVLAATTVIPDDDGATRYYYLSNDNAPIHQTAGLIDMARQNYHRAMWSYADGDEDE